MDLASSSLNNIVVAQVGAFHLQVVHMHSKDSLKIR